MKNEKEKPWDKHLKIFFFLYDFNNFNKSWVEGSGYFVL